MMMSGIHGNAILSAVMIILSVLIGGDLSAAPGSGPWQSPFEKKIMTNNIGDSLSFDEVIALIAEKNPVLKTFEWRLKSADGRLRQAGLWSNPELEIEFEEIGWDAPGFKETEMSFMLSQDFEIFGQRGARKKLATANIDRINWENRKNAFELYLIAKDRFYTLSHAREMVKLAREALEIADVVFGDIEQRSNQGAALTAEMLLSKLESQKARLHLIEARREMMIASLALSSLWGGKDSNLVLICNGIVEHECLKGVADFSISADSSSRIIDLIMEQRLLESERQLLAAESKPVINLAAGIKRLQSEKSNSFVFGISLPLPFLNRNQGEINALQAETKALQYEIIGSGLEASAEVDSHIWKIVQLDEKLELIDTLLLPTAEKTYESLQQAYNAGRISYAGLLEGKRALITLRSEKNDVHLLIREEQLQLEKLIGIPLN